MNNKNKGYTNCMTVRDYQSQTWLGGHPDVVGLVWSVMGCERPEVQGIE